MFVLACGIALAIPIARASAETVDGLNSKLAGAREQAEELNAEIEDSVVALAAAKSEARRAAGREAELGAVLAKGEERSADLAEKLAGARAELQAAQERLVRAQDALSRRLVDIYKSGDINPATVLLDADGFDDLATRAELLGRIQAADRALAERVRSLRAQIADQVERVDIAKERSDALNAEISAARDEISAARAAAEAEAAELAEARSAQTASVDELEGRMADWSEQVEKLERVPEEEADAEVGSWGDFGEWAIPAAIVMCESGGNFSALNPASGAGGAYQILPSTWRLYGGKGLPHQASPAEQHRIAALIWADSGPSAWVCAG
ncbi:MAG TPA: transglycosylase family protein [Solirubrobacterales bacterium]|nr:transglycosylase family protein [Solirubrobacterales bacterium]